jgi:hypothetical protein
MSLKMRHHAKYHVIVQIKASKCSPACGTAPHKDRHSLRSDVPTRVAILRKCGRHSRHRAVERFPVYQERLGAQIARFYISNGQYKLNNTAIVEKVFYDIKGESFVNQA